MITCSPVPILGFSFWNFWGKILCLICMYVYECTHVYLPSSLLCPQPRVSSSSSSSSCLLFEAMGTWSKNTISIVCLSGFDTFSLYPSLRSHVFFLSSSPNSFLNIILLKELNENLLLTLPLPLPLPLLLPPGDAGSFTRKLPFPPKWRIQRKLFPLPCSSLVQKERRDMEDSLWSNGEEHLSCWCVFFFWGNDVVVVLVVVVLVVDADNLVVSLPGVWVFMVRDVA